MDKEYCNQLAKILICPKTKKPLVYDEKLKAFVNKECHIIYKIEDGIPVMLYEEKELKPNDASKNKKKNLNI